MLKVSNKLPTAEDNSPRPTLIEFMALEEGETLESVRNPEKRKEALDLLEQMKAEWEAKCTPGTPDENTYGQIKCGTLPKTSARFNSMSNQLFQLLMDHFLPTRPPEDENMILEIRRILDNEEIDADTCYNSTFCCYVIRIALKDYHLPIETAKLWKTFTHNYCSLVMSALYWKGE